MYYVLSIVQNHDYIMISQGLYALVLLATESLSGKHIFRKVLLLCAPSMLYRIVDKSEKMACLLGKMLLKSYSRKSGEAHLQDVVGQMRFQWTMPHSIAFRTHVTKPNKGHEPSLGVYWWLNLLSSNNKNPTFFDLLGHQVHQSAWQVTLVDLAVYHPAWENLYGTWVSIHLARSVPCLFWSLNMPVYDNIFIQQTCIYM